MEIGGDRMTTEFMRDLLSKDEKITVEYKTCQQGIQEDVYETVCSFSNRYGGYTSWVWKMTEHQLELTKK